MSLQGIMPKVYADSSIRMCRCHVQSILLKSLITKPMCFTLNASIEIHHQHSRLFTTNYGFKDSFKILSTDLYI